MVRRTIWCHLYVFNPYQYLHHGHIKLPREHLYKSVTLTFCASIYHVLMNGVWRKAGLAVDFSSVLEAVLGV